MGVERERENERTNEWLIELDRLPMSYREVRDGMGVGVGDILCT